eukprot:TRINITY_DN18065_c0_g1_i1.p1 TRINITY_DN18065_c0_g1~~TRINITY_DN18065_c0_g1_i1.p1  ORF type:complete len:257 (-),score=80.36 TRINITY_DN18065_c0_g1_i1:68-838(-)
MAGWGVKIELYKTATMQVFRNVYTAPSPSLAPSCVIFKTLDLNVVAVGLHNGDIIIHNVARNMRLGTLVPAPLPPSSSSVSPPLTVHSLSFIGTELLISSDNSGHLRMWNTTTQQQTSSLLLPATNQKTAFSQHPSMRFVVVQQANYLYIVDTSDENKLHIVRQLAALPDQLFSCACFSASGKNIFCGLASGAILLISFDTLEVFATVPPNFISHSLGCGIPLMPTCISACHTPGRERECMVGTSAARVFFVTFPE